MNSNEEMLAGYADADASVLMLILMLLNLNTGYAYTNADLCIRYCLCAVFFYQIHNADEFLSPIEMEVLVVQTFSALIMLKILFLTVCMKLFLF